MTSMIPSVEVGETRAARELLKAHVATYQALRSVRATCRELRERLGDAETRAAPGGLRHPAPDPASPRLPPASPLWA